MSLFHASIERNYRSYAVAPDGRFLLAQLKVDPMRRALLVIQGGRRSSAHRTA
ncbi:MAG: hypothetical protein U0Q12_14720 [Vicinamibacterales bacterium]